jgi:putative transposase
MSYAKVYIHFVWSTKKGKPMLTNPELRATVWNHIKQYGDKNSIHIDCVNGYDNHCHCLVSMDRDQTMSQIMHAIKGESAHWINTNKLCREKFQWQPQYFAISVSESIVERVRNYIKKQERHHGKKSYQDEVDLIVARHGFVLK